MKQHLKEAIIIVIYNFFLIPILAITGIYIWQGSIIDLIFAVAAFLNFLIILPAVYGRLTERVLGIERKTYTQILEEHWVNYAVVFLIIVLPLAVFVYFVGSSKSYVHHIISLTVVQAIINALIIYVFPYVFVENEGVSAIPEGVRFLVKNLKYSAPLIILTVAIYVIKQISILAWNPHTTGNVFRLIGIGFITNTITVFISLVVFVAACKVLIEKRKWPILPDVRK